MKKTKESQTKENELFLETVKNLIRGHTLRDYIYAEYIFDTFISFDYEAFFEVVDINEMYTRFIESEP